MKNATLMLLIDEESKKILLGMKKRGFGAEKWNGFGGKVEENEDIKDAAIREMFEESGIKVLHEHAEKMAELDFFFSEKPEWNQRVHVFVSKNWEGKPIESNEMLPKWFKFEEIPFEKMWADDTHWLPKLLDGEKVSAEFTFEKDNETIGDIKWH